VGLTMAERKAVTRQIVDRYQKGSKAVKGRVLDELCALTGWNRDHARKALRRAAEPPRGRSGSGRPRIYGEEILEPLRRIWATLDGPSGKRLAPFMTDAVEAMERHGELHVDFDVRRKVLSMSAATIDRLLAPERARLQVKGRSGTKPGSILKGQIPIRTFAEWVERTAGFCEVDLVAHDGGESRGEFCQTLTLTCVFSGWTELRAVPNKAQRHVFEALQRIRADLPFPLLGLDCDNGSEFINHHLQRYCEAEGITFTRSRPWRKNDNCFVEQKNWTAVRQQVGYARYQGAEDLGALNELYGVLRSYLNFFQPQMRLVEKTRQGARVSRRYDIARTPHRRLTDSATARLTHDLDAEYLQLNPVALKRQIAGVQRRLIELSRRPKEPPWPTPQTHPWRDDGHGFSRASFMRQRTTRSRAS
jgi:hypothetical protein